MTRSAKLENQFVGDGYYDLCLRIGELVTLQEKLNVGPYVLAQRFLSGEWLVQDVTEVIRLALIGGGMDQRKAFDHVKQNVVEGHFLEYAGLAGNIVFASISGVEDEDVPGEATAPTTMEKHDH